MPKYDVVVGGYVGLVADARWGALREGMYFSHLKMHFYLIYHSLLVKKLMAN